jgi:hypothetical protein
MLVRGNPINKWMLKLSQLLPGGIKEDLSHDSLSEGQKSNPGSSKIQNAPPRRSVNIVTDLINALPGNSFLNTVQHEIIEEVVFSVSAVTAHNSR